VLALGAAACWWMLLPPAVFTTQTFDQHPITCRCLLTCSTVGIGACYW
jgi:hypothetical protein